MRCKNCGYVNEDNVSRCIKCNAELGGVTSTRSSRQYSSPTQSEEFQPAQTICEPSSSIHSSENGTAKRQRPEPFKSKYKETQQAENAQYPYGGTINPWVKKKGTMCWLKSIDYEPGVGPFPEHGKIVCCNGDKFELTRGNTNPIDNTISSHQAVLTHDGNEWYIEDTSTYHSTAIIASRRIKLEEGDTIVLGSSRFVFTEERPPMNT